MNAEERKEFIVHRIEKAREAIEEVEVLYGIEHYGTAASRLYYAAFYAASALLAQKEFDIKTHAGVRNELNRAFVKTGILLKDQGRLFSKLFDLRQLGDYGEKLDVSKENLDTVKKNAFDLIHKMIALVKENE